MEERRKNKKIKKDPRFDRCWMLKTALYSYGIRGGEKEKGAQGAQVVKMIENENDGQPKKSSQSGTPHTYRKRSTTPSIRWIIIFYSLPGLKNDAW